MTNNRVKFSCIVSSDLGYTDDVRMTLDTAIKDT